MTTDTALNKRLFQLSTMGMVVTDVTGKIRDVNPAVCEMIGRNRADLLDADLLSLARPERLGELDKAFQQVAGGHETSVSLGSGLVRSDGAAIWVDLNLTLLESEGDERLCFVIVKDRTEHRREHEELRLAKEAAEAATLVKSEFLANMSHEIRTPIHTIIGMGELIKDTQLDDEQSEYARQIHFAAEILLDLVEDILDFSKIEAGKLVIESMEFDLTNLVEDSVELFALEAHQKALEILTYVNPDCPRRVTGDPHRIRQIIINLVKNAIKFTHAGEIVVGVDPIQSKSGRPYLRFTCRDTGIGIAEHVRSKLFQSFSQVDSSTTRKYGGSGLGLTISRKLSEMMGGRIGVKSRPGAGSVFWFVLPAPVATGGEPARERASLEGRRILIVDDSRSVRDTIKRYLTPLGADVVEATNGEMALALLKKNAETHPFELALIDTRLPGIDGWQLGGQINEDREINDIHLILLTQAGKGGDEAKMMLLRWFDAYLGKPVHREKLIDLVVGTLEESVDLEVAEPELSPTDMAPGRGAGVHRPVLVAEDHEVNQMLFRTILEKMGFQVHVAPDGAVATRLARENDYELIFMDIQMPNMNGLEATEQIREAGVTTPIIAVTASALKEDMEKCYAVGMNDYLTKPFKKGDLEPILGKWIGVATATDGEDGEARVSDSDGKDIFDWQEAVETFMGEADVVRNLLKTYQEKAEEDLAKAKAAVKSGNFEMLREAAHAVKGSSLNLSMRRMGGIAAALQDAAAGKEKDKCAQLTEQALKAYQELRQAIPRIIGQD